MDENQLVRTTEVDTTDNRPVLTTRNGQYRLDMTGRRYHVRAYGTKLHNTNDAS